MSLFIYYIKGINKPSDRIAIHYRLEITLMSIFNIIKCNDLQRPLIRTILQK